MELIADLPELGKPTDIAGVRIKIIRDYLIYYRVQDKFVDIITVWDSRRNPEKLKKRVK